MSKKIIFIIIIIIIVGLVGSILYFNIIKKPEKIPEQETTLKPTIPLPEPWDFQAEGYVLIGTEDSTYHIISGQLMPEQIEQLAGKVIEDILDQEPDLKEATLFFYSELANSGIDEPDVARIDWADGKLDIEIK